MNKKYILTGDMPSSCRRCDIEVCLNANLVQRCGLKWSLDTSIGCETNRHPQCPLQDTTELLEALDRITKTAWADGDDYNKLYKAIGGE